MRQSICTVATFVFAFVATSILAPTQARQDSGPSMSQSKSSSEAKCDESVKGTSLIQASSKVQQPNIHGTVNLFEDDLANLDDVFDDRSPSVKQDKENKTQNMSVFFTAALGVCFSAVVAHVVRQALQMDTNPPRADDKPSTNEPCTPREKYAISSEEALQAVQTGDVHRLSELLNAGSNPNSEDAWACTLLHAAASQGDLKITNLLLKHDANVNSSDAWHETPLHMAARACQTDVCKLLVEWKAEVNAMNLDDHTPLFVAAKSNSKEVCEYLLSEDAHVGQASEEDLPPIFTSLLLQRIALGCQATESSL